MSTLVLASFGHNKCWECYRLFF